MPTYRFGDLTVTTWDDSRGTWRHGGERGATPYRITVLRGRLRYKALAWGAEGQPARVAAGVVDDLLSAVSDREAFVTGAMGEATGREALHRARQAEKIVRAGRKFGYAVLEEAVEDARERGLL